MSIPKPIIIDISEWQPPIKINYDVLAKQIDGVIIRVQYGSNYMDKHYKTHIQEFKKRGIPFGVYAWVRGTSDYDMQVEANDFWNRAKAFNPSFWWLDIEEQSMKDMRSGVESFRRKLKQLGAEKVGCYVANHLYPQFNIDISKFDGVWIPTYGKNNGFYEGSNPTATNAYDIHQYTSEGRLEGYNGALDLNRIVRKGFDYFFNNQAISTPTKPTETGGINMKKITVTVDGVKLRTSTNTNNDENVIAKLKKNDVININDIVIQNGFVWGVQPRFDGKKGYIDIGKSVSWVK